MFKEETGPREAVEKKRAGVGRGLNVLWRKSQRGGAGVHGRILFPWNSSKKRKKDKAEKKKNERSRRWAEK